MTKRSLSTMNPVSDGGKTGADGLALDISKGMKCRGHRVIGSLLGRFENVPEEELSVGLG